MSTTRTNISIAAVSLIALLLCSGCGTIITHAGSREAEMNVRRNGVYQGVRLDSYFITEQSWIGAIYGVADFPFSLVADTLILPYDLVDSARQKKDLDCP
jgi:uncharacterized protein YceK